VKDLAASIAFYEKLGFTEFTGDAAQGWLILKSPSCTIGLFQGMFDNNILTFNPGWDYNAQHRIRDHPCPRPSTPIESGRRCAGNRSR
jgi:catechol 2,3-dioxygenase-like lactoylglutathione lyase family enzyme